MMIKEERGGGGGGGGYITTLKDPLLLIPLPQVPVRCAMTPAYSYCTLRLVRLCLRIETSIIFLLHNTCSNTKDIKKNCPVFRVYFDHKFFVQMKSNIFFVKSISALILHKFNSFTFQNDLKNYITYQKIIHETFFFQINQCVQSYNTAK